MGYELSVSEVGPAEYPLIEVLRETIFAEVGHVSHTTLAEDLDSRQDVFALIAHLEGNPVGYKVGYRFGPGVYYSSSGGVLKDYRHNGLARQMQRWQHGWARARGYRRIFFNSFNHFKDMIRFGLDNGFIPIGAERQSVGAMSFKFARDLGLPDDIPPASSRGAAIQPIHAETVGTAQHGLIAAMASLAGEIPAEGELEREMKRLGATASVVYLGDKAVGFALGRPADDATFLTSRFAIVDTYQRQGAELVLARHQLNLARSMDCRAARWEVGHDQVIVLRSALDAGYDFTGLRHDSPMQRTRVLLEQRLAK